MVRCLLLPPSCCATLFPYTTLFRSIQKLEARRTGRYGRSTMQRLAVALAVLGFGAVVLRIPGPYVAIGLAIRSEEHTSELQSPCNLVCRLLLGKKKF